VGEEVAHQCRRYGLPAYCLAFLVDAGVRRAPRGRPVIGSAGERHARPRPAIDLSLPDHLRSVSALPIRSLAFTARIAGQSDGYSGRTSATIQIARSRSFGG
jgi:hypothetical protein